MSRQWRMKDLMTSIAILAIYLAAFCLVTQGPSDDPCTTWTQLGGGEMSGELKESDWKVLRELHPIALERFCRRALDEIEQVASAADRSCHERYLDVLRLVDRRGREMAHAFDDMRRSRALQRLTSIQLHELLTEEELGRFSPEMREALRFMLELNQPRSAGRTAGRSRRTSSTEDRDAP